MENSKYSGLGRADKATGRTSPERQRRAPRAGTPAPAQGGQQGRKESNLLRGFWRPAALPGARPCMCPAMPGASCPGRSRTYNPLLNRETHYRCATGQDQSGWSDLNRRSPAPRAGGLPCFPTSWACSRTSRLSHFLPPVVVRGGCWSRTNPREVSARTEPFVSSDHWARLQSVQRELNPHIYHGKVAGYRYIMDAGGPRASCRSHELPDLNRFLQIWNLALKPISKFVCCDRRARLPVPAAGVEPAASAFSARRSHHLSYTGMKQRRRQESNLRQVGLQPTAGAVRSGVMREPAVGLEPTLSALRERRSTCRAAPA